MEACVQAVLDRVVLNEEDGVARVVTVWAAGKFTRTGVKQPENPHKVGPVPWGQAQLCRGVGNGSTGREINP